MTFAEAAIERELAAGSPPVLGFQDAVAERRESSPPLPSQGIAAGHCRSEANRRSDIVEKEERLLMPAVGILPDRGARPTDC